MTMMVIRLDARNVSDRIMTIVWCLLLADFFECDFLVDSESDDDIEIDVLN